MSDSKNKDFNFFVPLDVFKGSDGEWRVKGLASTEHMDLQGEVVRQNSLDITPLKEGKGLFNWDHQSGPENVVGAIEGAEIKNEGLFVEGYLFKNSKKAQAVHEILTSLKDKDKRRLGFSIEGKILRRAGQGGREIAAARVEKVALTFDPVNPNTYAQLVKSLAVENGSEPVTHTSGDGGTYIVESETNEVTIVPTPEAVAEMFTADEVRELVKSCLQKNLEEVLEGKKYDFEEARRIILEAVKKAIAKIGENRN